MSASPDHANVLLSGRKRHHCWCLAMARFEVGFELSSSEFDLYTVSKHNPYFIFPVLCLFLESAGCACCSRLTWDYTSKGTLELDYYCQVCSLSRMRLNCWSFGLEGLRILEASSAVAFEDSVLNCTALLAWALLDNRHCLCSARMFFHDWLLV